ncbi:tetraspanin-8-like [Zingiber officinale]|uniref:Senescence-associated protein n=1 Tax=Zingiber officinale TaxID=94328 RepID=A0A8J5KZX1_ZINOF|nr:tetraspanin-8-like [Zingiber officinale]KAG6499302.1 hypothetical protein ZIOFF_039059 [Zingiber officinale]
MFRLSNNLIGVLNFVTFLLSLPILGGGIWLATRGGVTDCEKFLQTPLILIGVFFMLVSLAGLVGACCRNTLLLSIYLSVMFILIVVLTVFTVFAFVVTNKGAGEVTSNRGYKEYRLGDYSHWLQKRVENSKNWARIRACLSEAKVCQSLRESNQTFDQFISDNLSPIESGCCKPPSECNFDYQNATLWTAPATDANSSNPDCSTWSNNQSILCYDCRSCKAGVIANAKDKWKKIAILNIIILIFLIIVYSVGCCAFRNNRRDNDGPVGWKGGYA